MWTDIHPSLNQEKNYKLNEGNSNTVLMTVITIQENIENHCNFSSMKVMSADEMNALLGGCGSGGTCEDYDCYCGTGCTTLSGLQCSGSVGNCINNYFIPVCKCGSDYVFIKGC